MIEPAWQNKYLDTMVESPFHEGELAVQQRVGEEELAAKSSRIIKDHIGVEIEMMETRDGRSIGMEEPLGPWAMGYKQYKSTYSVTNAYTAKWDISSATYPNL